MINRKTKRNTKRNTKTKKKNYKSKHKKGGMICISSTRTGTPHTPPKIGTGTPHTTPKTGTPTKDESPIGVISYNISWEAMTGSATGTAGDLGQHCATQSIGHTVGAPTTCLYNVQDFLQKEVNDPSKNICFIGLQEAALWKTIVKDKGVLQKMRYVQHSIKKDTYDVDLCTLYDATKFKVLGAKWGNLVAVGDVRPYHIIFLRRISNDAIYIFINLHNGHTEDKDKLEKALTRDIDNYIDLENGTNIYFENIQVVKKIKKTSGIITSDPFVIVVGDTNDKDASNRQFYKGIQPFKNSSITFLKAITVKTDNQPPNTCCNTQRKTKNDSMLGDYIMINNKLKYIVENIIPDNFEVDYTVNPTSDHLPIYSSLKEK
jgi:hypothetical protein